MATPRIAVSQSPYIREVDGALERNIEHIRHAASRGVDVVIFPEWSLGLNPVEVLPNRHTERLSRLARELNVMVITGSVRALEPESGKKQQRSLVIEPDGTLAGSQAKLIFYPTERPWFEPGPGITAISTRWGRIVILPGLDALNDDCWNATLELAPDLVVMATSPKNLAERHRLQELAIQRSQTVQGTVVLTPLIGRFSGSAYVGGAVIAQSGRVLAMADEQETILIAGDPEAPLIQLGVTDASAYIPLTRPLHGNPLDVKRAIGPEGERKVLVDWGLLKAPDISGSFEELLSLSQDNPRWVSLAPARPDHAAELRQMLSNQAKGAFAYPGIDHCYPWADEVRALGQVLQDLPRPLLVYSGPGAAPLRFDNPALWDEFLMEFTNFPVILHSMGQRSPYLEEALVLAERHPQVYLETSRAPLGAVKEAIGGIGADRVLFGSGGLAREFTHEWEKVERLEAELSPEAFQKVVNLNARRLFFQTEDAGQVALGNVHPFKRPS